MPKPRPRPVKDRRKTAKPVKSAKWTKPKPKRLQTTAPFKKTAKPKAVPRRLKPKAKTKPKVKVPVKKPAKRPAKVVQPPPKKPRKPRTSKPPPKTYAAWGVFDNNGKRLETFPFPDKAGAERCLAKKRGRKLPDGNYEGGVFYVNMIKES